MTDFPIDTAIFNKIIEVFNQTRSYVLLLFPLAFFIRIALGFILLKSEGFTDILKDSLFLFLGLFFFTDILKMSLQIPYFVSSELSLGDWRNINLGEGLFINFIRRIVDWIGILSYWISFGLYIVIVSVLGFFAGYVLFFGTMFRAYGALKVFFILLFTVSLWPLLWYSVNFAVFTVAVSDNALANNVIIGSASLAKVFIPIWLISKASRVPIAQNLKRLSYAGGGMAYAGANLAYQGGSQAYSLLKKTDQISQNQEIQNEETINNEGAEINVLQTKEEGIAELEENIPLPETDYISGLEDFSLNQKENTKPDTANLLENNQNTKQETEEKQAATTENNTVIENSVSKENHISQESHVHNETRKEIQSSSPSQTTYEIKERAPLSKDYPIQSENIATNYQNHESVSPTSRSEEQQSIFNESIHKESFIENKEEYTDTHSKKQSEKENEL
ncbi:MAG: hypothetical protein OXM55_07485 [Bdellovibrionales bacterium]|nr:hypothetical protein [Bdellovibrionales bacterium]